MISLPFARALMIDSIEMTFQEKKRLDSAEPTIPYITLPPELLIMIFIACAAPPSGTLNSRHWIRSANMQWIAVTHVCRYWRSVALGCTELWRKLFFFNPDVTKEMIRRSKGTNLEVIIVEPVQSRQSKNKIIEMILSELHRVSVLQLHLVPESLKSFIGGFVPGAPKLESLCLNCTDEVHIPDAIFSRQTPALRSLKLYNCKFTSPSPSPDFQTVRIPSIISQIVSFLCRTPMLHTLILFNVLPKHVSTDTGAYPKLVLPKLSLLDVFSSVVSCAVLLEHLNFPITTNITLQCNLDPLRNNGHRRLFRAFLSAIGNEKATFIISALKLEINNQSMRRNTINMLYTVSHDESAPTKVTFKFFADVYDRKILRDIFNAASVTLPPADAHALDIAGNGPYWPINFDSLPNIRTIRFKTHHFPLEIVDAALGDEGHSHKLPNLCSLQFFNLIFSDEHKAALINGLKNRLLSGFPIKNICFRICFNLKKTDVIRLKEFVQDVEWDEEQWDEEPDP
jgi:F-box-like